MVSRELWPKKYTNAGNGGNQGRHRGELTLIEEGNGGNQVDSRKMTSTLTK